MTAESDVVRVAAERLWTDPTRPVRRGGDGVVYPWPLRPVVLKVWRGPGAVYREPGAAAHGHARAVWEHMAGLAAVAVRVGRLGVGTVDTDLEFLSAVSGHVVGCRVCRSVDGNGGTQSAQDVLWAAVGKVPRLRQLVGSLDRDPEMDEEMA
jgi:hypothetical protein